MRRIVSAVLAAVLALGLTACSSSDEELVSKTLFPEFSEVDTQGNTVTSDIFADYDATIVNFWNNGCGTCIEEMPELEEYYQGFKEKNINLIGVASDSGESDDQLETARGILEEKGVTYTNLSPSPQWNTATNTASNTMFVSPAAMVMASPSWGFSATENRH